MEEARAVQIEVLRSMTPEQKFRVMSKLYATARALKAAWVREQHPEWTAQKVKQAVTETFLYSHE